MVRQHKRIIRPIASFSAGISTTAITTNPTYGDESAGGPTISNYAALMWAGTVLGEATPQFVVSGYNTAPVKLKIRLVSVSTPELFVEDAADEANGRLVPIPMAGYPRTDVSDEIMLKPGIFSIANILPSFPVIGVVLFETTVRIYDASSFDATGALKRGAKVLDSDVSHWKQTDWKNSI